MIEPLTPDVLQRCKAAGIEPMELQTVASRYQAYRDFYARAGRGQGLGVEEWFRWYCIEVASDTAKNSASPGGCSVDGDSRNNAMTANPGAFLQILRAVASGVTQDVAER